LIYFILILILTQAIEVHPKAEEKLRVSKKRINRHFHALAHDSMAGREIGTTGEKKASEYIASKFENAGLEEPESLGGYFQRVPVIRTKALDDTDLTFINGNQKKEMTLNKDYLLAQYTRNTYIPDDVELVFAGYGITAPEYDYNDYHELDASGKVVVMIGGEPVSGDPAYFNGNAPSIHSYPDSKFRTAIARGAVASILLPKPTEAGYVNWRQLQKDYSFDEVMLAYAASFNLSMLIEPASAEILFKNSGYTIKDVYKMYETGKMKSFELESRIKFKIKAKSSEGTGRNVIGLIPGKHPEKKNTAIIITAHYDHLGIGYKIENDSIYNGAMDNALGVSGLIELAEAMNNSNFKPDRTIIFLASTGEEKGLLGSKFYTDNPVIPLHKTAANINIDGLAFIDRFKSVIGIGSEYSELETIMKEAAENMGLKFEEIPEEFKSPEAFNRSDQIAFAQAGIPSVLVLDGLDYRTLRNSYAMLILEDYFKNIYHTPFDDLKIPVSYDASALHLRYINELVMELDKSSGLPEWHKDAPFRNARLRSKAEQR